VNNANPAEPTLSSFLEQARRRRRPVILLEGTRKVPEQAVAALHRLAVLLAEELPKAVFRSGNAEGSDTHFFQGLAAAPPERLEYILPFPGSGKRRIRAGALVASPDMATAEEFSAIAGDTVTASPATESLLRLFAAHGRNRVTAKAAYLLRDTMKVAGASSIGLAPADFGFFFVNPEAPRAGGTGHTIRVCRAMQVPVFTQDEWEKWL